MKNFVAIIVGSVIIGFFVYLGLKDAKEIASSPLAPLEVPRNDAAKKAVGVTSDVAPNSQTFGNYEC